MFDRDRQKYPHRVHATDEELEVGYKVTRSCFALGGLTQTDKPCILAESCRRSRKTADE